MRTKTYFSAMLGFRPFSCSEHTGYRFGFNGMEKDDEVSGNGNSYTATFWQYDSRLGRRWNLDPKTRAQISNYSCFSNNPIIFVDPLGDDDYYNRAGEWVGNDGQGNGIRLTNSEFTSRESFSQLLELGGVDYVRSDKLSTVVTIQKDVTEHMQRLYDASYKSQPQREKAGLIVLDTKNATLSIVNQPADPSDTKSKSAVTTTPTSKTNPTTGVTKSWRYPSLTGNKSQIVVGQVHTHPDEMNDLSPGSTGYVETFERVIEGTSRVEDRDAARDLNVPVHAIDGTGDIHRVLPDGTPKKNIPNDQNFLKESLEIYGGKPKGN